MAFLYCLHLKKKLNAIVSYFNFNSKHHAKLEFLLKLIHMATIPGICIDGKLYKDDKLATLSKFEKTRSNQSIALANLRDISTTDVRYIKRYIVVDYGSVYV